MKSNVFVYGRTKNQDYRWLQKPNIALNASFFARILENNSNLLKRNEKLFMFISTPNLYMLAYIFKDFSSMDERGRPISFIVGLTCNLIEGREFNYRLPALLQQHNLITNLIKNDLMRVINTNSSFNIENFNISQVTYIENEKFISELEDNTTTLNSSILEIAKKLNNKVVIPNLESNFNVTDINDILKEENNAIFEGEKKLNNNISTPSSESDFKVTGINNVLEGANSFIKKGGQELKKGITPSSVESNIKIVNRENTPPKCKEENQTNSSLMSQLENFNQDKSKKHVQTTNDVISSSSDSFDAKKHLTAELEEIIKFRPSSILAKLYNEEGEKGGLFTKKISFQDKSFLTLYKKLRTYDNQVLNVCERVIKIIDKS